MTLTLFEGCRRTRPTTRTQLPAQHRNCSGARPPSAGSSRPGKRQVHRDSLPSPVRPQRSGKRLSFY